VAYSRPDPENRLYGDLAWAWPLISPPETYVEEAETFARTIREGSSIPVTTVLHLGSGGGHVDWRLKRDLEITGVDLSEAMVGLSRRLNPEATYVVGDMRTVRLGRLFDAVLIHDAIVYMLTEDDLRACFETAFAHLRPGGVMITYVEAEPSTFVQNRTTASTRGGGDVEIVFVENDYDPDPSDTWFETTFVYLIRRDGKLTIETDRHLCNLFPVPVWTENLRAAGFRVEETTFGHSEFPEGLTYPMFVCTKPEATSAE